MSQIFIAQDTATSKELAEAATILAAAGHRVVRGPAITAGVKQVFSPDHYHEYFRDTDIIVVTSRNVCSREVMMAAPRLRGIVTPTIGVDAVDLAAAGELGVIIGHGAMPENFISVAESAVMLFTALFYHAKRTESLLRQDTPRPWERRARMVQGKTIGLIGFGRIARAVAERLQGWGVKLLVYDPYVNAADLPSFARAADLPTLLQSSDLVSLHVTLNSETHHLIGEAQIRSMKPGAFLVNTSRGGVIDEDAAYRACRDGHLGGLALDTFEKEPLSADSPLRELTENVYLTPHFLSHTCEAHEVMPGVLVQNIERVLAGEPPLYTYNPKAIAKWRERLAMLAGN